LKFLNIDRVLKKMTKSIDFKVQMSCSGCSGAITRILSKIDGKKSNIFMIKL
jgi:copper chaperone CopZ